MTRGKKAYSPRVLERKVSHLTLQEVVIYIARASVPNLTV